MSDGLPIDAADAGYEWCDEHETYEEPDNHDEARPDASQAFGVAGGNELWRLILEAFARAAK